MSFLRFFRALSLCLAALLSSVGLRAVKPLNSVPLRMAGKSLLIENGYLISRKLGVANFSPELRIPVQLIYAMGE